MDEGRLAVVFRREEQHRKFVYVMNDIVRAKLSLYSNCLAREQHESSVKLLKNCSEVRRSIVRQKVLKKCLEMRKRKIVARDPSKTFGQYGGKPLWAMSREIDGVIANNHPKIRRMKRVEEVMRQSLESGAILDDEAVSRRMDAFFQLKQSQKEKPPKRAPELAPPPLVRRNLFKPPAWMDNSSETIPQGNVPAQSTRPPFTELQGRPGHPKAGSETPLLKDKADKRKGPDPTRTRKETTSSPQKHPDNSGSVTNRLSLEEGDSKGSLRRVTTSRLDQTETEGEAVDHSRKAKNSPLGGESGPDRKPVRTEHAESGRGGRVERGAEECGAGMKDVQYRGRGSEDGVVTKSRSRLILPPIQSTKAMVTGTLT